MYFKSIFRHLTWIIRRINQSFLILIFTINLGCSEIQKAHKENANNSSNTSLVEKSLTDFDIDILAQLDSINCDKRLDEKYSYVIIYYFKGDCSTCIANFIQWSTEVTSDNVNYNVKLIFINSAVEMDLVLYYLDQYNPEFNCCLLHDPYQVVLDKFPVMNEDIYNTHILLVDRNSKVLAYGDPIKSKRISQMYEKNKIFNDNPK